jgi:hypothetical protein
VKKTEATELAWHSSKIELAGLGSTSAARDMATATGSNSVSHGSRLQGVVEEWGDEDEEEMADVDEEEEAVGGVRDITMAETEISTWTVTGTETGALDTND